MLKICRPSICSKPLKIIFKSCLESGIFLLEWNKTNVVPVHKRIINNFSQTTGQSHHLRYVEKYLSVCYIMKSLYFTLQITFFHKSVRFETWILTSINSYQLPMKYMRRLMREMKSDVYFLPNQRHLIRFGTRVSS